MSNFISISFTATGEHFDVPYQPQTTIHDLIKYVCIQSTALSNSKPSNYYLTINRSDILDNNRTVEQTGLNQPNRFVSLEMCIKTQVLMKRISESHIQFWQDPDQQTARKVRRTTLVQKSVTAERPSSSTNQQQMQTTTATVSDDNGNTGEVHILVVGGPKVGKSTLINALCGCPVAKVNQIGLDRCTKKRNYYQLDNIYFWDTPGIQEWSNLNINTSLNLSVRDQTPLCMFYCASPGSFTKLELLRKLIEECIRRHIFCALVVTNMLTNVTRYQILDEFKALLNDYVKHKRQIKEENGVWYYEQIGLCTMVNSQEYVDEDTNQRKPQQGINELVLALTKSLSGTHQLNDWLRTIEKNQQFWLDKQAELYQLIENPHDLCLSEIIDKI